MQKREQIILGCNYQTLGVISVKSVLETLAGHSSSRLISKTEEGRMKECTTMGHSCPQCYGKPVDARSTPFPYQVAHPVAEFPLSVLKGAGQTQLLERAVPSLIRRAAK